MNWKVQVASCEQPFTVVVSASACECPLVDSCSLGRPLGQPRCPFPASRLLDCAGMDESAAVNSLCFGDPFSDCPDGGEAGSFSVSEYRIPLSDNLN